ncbi:MAG TPA: acetamidase [Clostridiaceae bacterium]|nr:acetamidase [Clostridiaceae bacterium]
MKIARRDVVYNEHSRFNKPGLVVEPKEEFIIETELCSGDWLKSNEDRFDLSKIRGCNPCVCVEIKGANPGSILAVKILDIQVNNIGFTGFDISFNPLATYIYPRQWGLTTKTVEIKDGYIHWSEKLKLPVKPMIGTIGTAPESEVLSNSRGGFHGGNMDANEVAAGSTVYLPVSVPGALLHVGDVHAIQGDGEISNGGGIECRATIRLVVDVVDKPVRMNCVRIEDNDYIMAVACLGTVEESFYHAAREILCWMVDSYGFTYEEAFLLMSQVMEARCTQFVNPTRTYICKMPKKYLIC